MLAVVGLGYCSTSQHRRWIHSVPKLQPTVQSIPLHFTLLSPFLPSRPQLLKVLNPSISHYHSLFWRSLATDYWSQLILVFPLFFFLLFLCPFFSLFFFFSILRHTLTELTRLALNVWSFCLCLLSAAPTGMCYHTRKSFPPFLPSSLTKDFRDQRHASVVRDTCHSSRGPQFGFQNPYGGAQLSITSVLEDATLASGPHGHQVCMWCRHTCRQNICTHNIKINAPLKNCYFIPT